MMFGMIKRGRVVVNGTEYCGNNVSIINGVVTIDGVAQDGTLTGPVNVTVHGDVQNLENGSGNVTAKNVGDISTGSGDVNCDAVSGSIRTGSGDVDCGTVGGNIRTDSGDVCHR